MHGGGEGRHSQVGGDGVPVPLPHGQHEVGDPVHQACLVLILLPMLLRHLQPNQGREDRSLVRRSDPGAGSLPDCTWARAAVVPPHAPRVESPAGCPPEPQLLIWLLAIMIHPTPAVLVESMRQGTSRGEVREAPLSRRPR